MDNDILDILVDNARATYSEIGTRVGLSRVAVKNRIEAMEKSGIIRGYKTVVDPTKTPQGIQFTIDVEAIPELYQEVKEALKEDSYLQQIYTTTGSCRFHAIGFAPNAKTLEAHVNYLFNRTKGIRKMSWHLLLTTVKDVTSGGEIYERKVPENI